MEIVFLVGIVVAIVVAAFVFGGMDNDSPASSWTDEKLTRMLPKLSHVMGLAVQASEIDKAEKYNKKINEIKNEISKRITTLENDRVKELGAKPFDLNDPASIAEMASIMAERSHNLLTLTMKENGCDEEKAGEIISQEIERLEEEFLGQGLDQEKATEAAMQQLLGLGS